MRQKRDSHHLVEMTDGGFSDDDDVGSHPRLHRATFLTWPFLLCLTAAAPQLVSRTASFPRSHQPSQFSIVERGPMHGNKVARVSSL